MDQLVIIMVCSITACIFSVVALILGFISLAKSVGIEKSTHSVQFMPPEQIEGWATPEKEIKEINEEFREEYESLGI